MALPNGPGQNSEDSTHAKSAILSTTSIQKLAENISKKPDINEGSLKRPYEENADESRVASKKIILHQDNPKNALCLLHELYRGSEFKIVNQEGPPNAPTFTASVEINGFIFEGKGRNKKTAKHSAAEAALRSLVQFKNPTSECPSLCQSSNDMDFTNDVLFKEINNFDVTKATGSSITIPNDGLGENGLPIIRHNVNNSKTQIIDKNPVMLLNELQPCAKYEIISDNGDQFLKYTMAVIINGQRFEGKGSSKKSSKMAAARSALLSFYNISLPACPSLDARKSYFVAPGDNSGVPQAFADHVSRLVNEKFMALMENDLPHIRRKVLSGFVMSQGYDINTCKVITVSTGTKCINGERMSVNGSVLNDSHAEIISRRCLCNFLYSELEKHLNESPENDSILIKQKNGFQLHPQYKFHLYINSAPCGDSRIFSPYDQCFIDKHPNRKARGQLRTKIECGEGTIPVKADAVIQTWDGVLQGERLLTMSCSDKIAKWNVVGLQGALLSNFIEPIYLDSIILGSLFHPNHLYRAVCGRVENTIHALPPPYRLNKPKLSKILNSEIRQIGKAPNFSVNWTFGDTCAEVVNAVSGRTEQNQISRISKCRLFYRFLKLLGKLPTISDIASSKGPMMYSQCKEKAARFQAAKLQLYKAFTQAQLGEWVKKPIEVDQFEWDENSLSKLLSSDSADGNTS